MNNVYVVIPAYNEEKTITPVIHDVQQYARQIIVVDDGSVDNTGTLAQKEGVVVLRHIVNRGQGAAIKTGIDYALMNGADVIVTFDSDGQHIGSDIPRVIQPILNGKVDVVIGSRFLDRKSNVPLKRKIVLKLAILFTWMVNGIKLTDAHNGLRAFSHQAAQKINIKQDRMAHASEFIHEISKHKFLFQEVPVTIRYTNYSMQKGQRTLNSLKIVFDLVMGEVRK
jgi:glycosyltransferase involved in cell wall biosynthesis